MSELLGKLDTEDIFLPFVSEHTMFHFFSSLDIISCCLIEILGMRMQIFGNMFENTVLYILCELSSY